MSVTPASNKVYFLILVLHCQVLNEGKYNRGFPISSNAK